jgi:hypothetical protein
MSSVVHDLWVDRYAEPDHEFALVQTGRVIEQLTFPQPSSAHFSKIHIIVIHEKRLLILALWTAVAARN